MNGDDPDDPDDTEALDPEEQAQLQAWFGGPFGREVVADDTAAQQDIDPELLGTSREPGIPDFLREARLEREATLDEVDLTMVARLENQHLQFGTRPAAPESVLDPSIVGYDGEQALDVAAPTVAHRQADDEIVSAMSDCTPQALLRDLHRVVKKTPWMQMVDLALGVPKMTGRSGRVHEAMTTRFTVNLDDEPNPRKYIAADLADMNQRIREEEWSTLDIDPDARREWSSVESADAALWFAGIDPSTLK